MKIIDKINQLKKKRQAVILAHNYQIPQIQEIGDFCGDSLELSRIAATTEAKIIVFCGVYFMAETAKILSPEKKVLLPEKEAGCPMADMITAAQLRELKQKHPQAKVLTYVNSSAEVKAESDVCCTSANAIRVAKKVFDLSREVIFVPDKFLAQYTASQIGRKFIMWPGYCPSHAKIMPEDIKKQKKAYPGAKVIVHPECRPDTIELADEVLSTSGMIKFAKETKAREVIVGTEPQMVYPLKKAAPDKNFYPATKAADCPNMKKINLEKVLWSLEDLSFEIKVEERIISAAQKSIKMMLKAS